jgi:single-strand DNA-binding protein
MAGSVNSVTLLGHLGKDPEIRTTQQGGKVCNLRVATSETWKDRETGERREKTEWHTVTIWNEPLAKVAEQFLRKGSKVYLTGSLETKKYQAQDGTDRYSTEVVLRPYRGELVLLDGKGDRESMADDYGGGRWEHQRPGHQSPADLDDEVPF